MSHELKLDGQAGEALRNIERIVRECVKDLAHRDAQEDPVDFGQDYESEQGYVSFWFSTDPDDPCPSLRIELGVHDSEKRHPMAGMKALWKTGDGIGQVQSIVMEGRQCGPVPFLRLLEGALAETDMRALAAQ